jgi:hypothetical protein
MIETSLKRPLRGGVVSVIVFSVLIAMNVDSPICYAEQIVGKKGIEQLKATMNSDVCATTPVERMRHGTIPDDCGGDGTRDPCFKDGKLQKDCAREYAACSKQWVADQNIINEYNIWADRKCNGRHVNKRDEELDDLRRDVYAREKADRANREKIRNSIPQQEHIIPSATAPDNPRR